MTYPLLGQADDSVRALQAHLRRYWVFWLSFLGTLTAAFWGLRPGISVLGERWEFQYNHGYLVLAMSAWLLHRSLSRASGIRLQPSWAGLGALAAIVSLYSLTELLDFSLGMQVVMPLVLMGVVAALGGMQLLARAVIPIAFLYFAIPIWDLAVPLLQGITIRVVDALIGIAGPPAYTVGTVIHIPAGTFEIADACSGVRYFMVSLAIATFWGLSWYRRWRTRVLLLAIAGFAAMLANWIRVYTLILIGQASDMQHYFIVESHEGYGWFVYVVLTAPVLWLASVLDRREPVAFAGAAQAREPFHMAAPASFLVFGLMTGAIVTSPVLLNRGAPIAVHTREVSLLPQGATGWRTADVGSWQPDFKAPYLTRQQSFVSGLGTRVDVYLARYLRQASGSKLTASNNRLHPGWQPVASSTSSISWGGTTRRVAQTEIIAGAERRLVWSWYMVGGSATHSRVQAKLMEVPALLRGRRDGAIVALSAACSASCEPAAEAMTELLAVAGPRLQSLAEGSAEEGRSDEALDRGGSGGARPW